MSPSDLRTARKALGLTQHALAEALRMGKNGWQSVSRWERDGSTIPGPVQVAVECLLKHRALAGDEWVDVPRLDQTIPIPDNYRPNRQQSGQS